MSLDALLDIIGSDSQLWRPRIEEFLDLLPPYQTSKQSS
jgi:hypothetical protein